MWRIIGVLLLGLALVAAAPAHAGDEIKQVASQSRSAVVMIQVKPTTIATGFLICEDPALVACVGHTAVNAEKPEDITVRVNETGTAIAVQRIYIHQDYRPNGHPERKTPYVPDWAILELANLDPGLGSPLTLSDPASEEDLRGCQVISFGFPPHTTFTQEGERESAEAMLRRGMIQRMVDYTSRTESVLIERPIVEYDLRMEDGDSGAPVINIATGRVVAIHSQSRQFPRKLTDEEKAREAAGEKVERTIVAVVPMGVRTNALWELLEQIGLADRIPKDQ